MTVLATGPGGTIGTLLFDEVTVSASTTHLVYLWNTGSQAFWIVQTNMVSSLSSSSLPPGSALDWNLTSSMVLVRGSTPLPVLLTFRAASVTGSFDFQVTVSVYQTPRG